MGSFSRVYQVASMRFSECTETIQEPMMNAASEGLGGNPFASLVNNSSKQIISFHKIKLY